MLTDNMTELMHYSESLLQRLNNASILMRLKYNAFNISINEVDNFTYDLEGRLIGVFINGINYRRGLDNTVLKKWSGYENNTRKRFREILSEEDKTQLFKIVESILINIWRMQNHLDITIRGNETECWVHFNKSRRFNYKRSLEDVEHFNQVYQPVSILPPDQYYSMVLQITEGCPYNKCTFCNFYKDRNFKIKNTEQVRSHMDSVDRFLGMSRKLRRSIFLADANAVIIPQKRLIEILEEIHKKYTIISDENRAKEINHRRRSGEVVFNGIFSFIDLFTGQHKEETDFREMREFGIKRVYLGIESGSESLLNFLNKPGSRENMIDAVNKMKSAGLQVGIIILIGAGGSEFYNIHVADTIEVLQKMDLDQNDFIYFSNFYPHENTEYVELADKQNITNLDYKMLKTQKKQIRAGLDTSKFSSPPKFAEYDLREFIY